MTKKQAKKPTPHSSAKKGPQPDLPEIDEDESMRVEDDGEGIAEEKNEDDKEGEVVSIPDMTEKITRLVDITLEVAHAYSQLVKQEIEERAASGDRRGTHGRKK